MLWNQGQLPDHWTVADLLQTHTSIPYNPAIANTFFRAGLIEAWGSGTLRIIEDCEVAKTPIPIFQYHLSGFGIEFAFKKMSEKSVAVSEKNEEMSEKNEEMSEKMLVLIKQMKENPKITIRQMAEQLVVSTKTIERFLKRLKETDQIRRKRGDKGGEWEVISV